MALVPSDIQKLLTAGLREEFMTTYEKVTNEYERIATVIQSNKATETFAWLGSTPKMREWKGERIPKGMLEKTYAISSRDWESSLAIDRNALEDENSSSLNFVNSEKSHWDNSELSPKWESAETNKVTKEEIAYAILLGDGYLSPLRNVSKNSRLCYFRKIGQRKYVEWVAQLCRRFWKLRLRKRLVGNGSNSKKSLLYGFQTRVYPFFTHLRKKVFYPKERKRVTQKILSKLTPLGLAIWYMDDGSLRTQKGSRRFILSTGSFTLKENKIIQDYFFRKWRIKFRLSFIRKTQPFLHCGVEEGLKLVKLIKPFIIPSMQYKIDLKYRMLNKSPLKAKILEVYPEYKK